MVHESCRVVKRILVTRGVLFFSAEKPLGISNTRTPAGCGRVVAVTIGTVIGAYAWNITVANTGSYVY